MPEPPEPWPPVNAAPPPPPVLSVPLSYEFPPERFGAVATPEQPGASLLSLLPNVFLASLDPPPPRQVSIK